MQDAGSEGVRSKKVHRSLENFDEYNITPPLLTSPRSLEACRRQGIEAEELVFRYCTFMPCQKAMPTLSHIVWITGMKILLQRLGLQKISKRFDGNIMRKRGERSFRWSEKIVRCEAEKISRAIIPYKYPNSCASCCSSDCMPASRLHNSSLPSHSLGCMWALITLSVASA